MTVIKSLTNNLAAFQNPGGATPQCRCGREIRPSHCPACGSTNLYGKSSNSEVVVFENERLMAKGFKCRRCTLDFNQSFICEAPPKALLSGKQDKALRDVLDKQQAMMSETGKNDPVSATMETIRRMQESRAQGTATRRMELQNQAAIEQKPELLFTGTGKAAEVLAKAVENTALTAHQNILDESTTTVQEANVHGEQAVEPQEDQEDQA